MPVRIAPISSPTGRIEPLAKLLRPEEVAELLQVTPRTVRRWGAAGVLERIRLGGRLTRYTPESVEALISPHNDLEPVGSGPEGKADDDGVQHSG